VHARRPLTNLMTGLRMSDPKTERLAAAERKPILAHLDDFRAALSSKGGDPKHVRQTRLYAARVIDLAATVSISGLTQSAVMVALSALRSEGLSARTLNAHLTAIKQFARWLQRDGRCLDNPLAGLSRMSEAADRRFVRRPLEADHARRLIDATRSAPPWRGMTGPDRAMLYLIGAVTGFRRGELASLRPECFQLTQSPPTIVCEAAYTKNGRTAEQPVPEALADLLRPWVAAKATDRPVFDTLPEKTAEMMRADLIAAGIDPGDESGRVVGMHSLRHGFITSLAKAGVPLKTLMTLARHSDPKLTMNVYSHLTIHDTAAALDSLPNLAGPLLEPEAMAATGTLGQHIDDRFALPLPYAGDGSSREPSDAGGFNETTPEIEGCRNTLEMSGLDASGRELSDAVGSAPRRTRTYNPLIKRKNLHNSHEICKLLHRCQFMSVIPRVSRLMTHCSREPGRASRSKQG
jgi:integrase